MLQQVQKKHGRVIERDRDRARIGRLEADLGEILEPAEVVLLRTRNDEEHITVLRGEGGLEDPLPRLHEVLRRDRIAV